MLMRNQPRLRDFVERDNEKKRPVLSGPTEGAPDVL